jgi:hypothetical protein
MIKSLLRPLLAPVLDWLDKRIDERSARVVESSRGVRAWNHYLPMVLDTIASQNAAAREERRRVSELSARVERLEQEAADPASRV